MVSQVEKILDSKPSDVRGWVRENFRRTLTRKELEDETGLREDVITIAVQAFYTNFVGDSNYNPDGIGLSRLKDYDPVRKNLIQVFVRDLCKAQDLCGYIRQYLKEAQLLRQEEVSIPI